MINRGTEMLVNREGVQLPAHIRRDPSPSSENGATSAAQDKTRQKGTLRNVGVHVSY